MSGHSTFEESVDTSGHSNDVFEGSASTLGGEQSSEESVTMESEGEEVFGDKLYDNWDDRAVDDIVPLGSVNLKELVRDQIIGLHFPNLKVAFAFYNLYAKMNGFSAIRHRLRRNVNNEVTQQSFVCFREGFKRRRGDTDAPPRKREPKPETRCGCEAEMRVNLHVDSGRWVTTYFHEVHNHEMLEESLTYMLPGHRMMNAASVDQMNMMLKVGIKTPQIYASFVQTAGGFQHVPFLKRDMYNQIEKQRRRIGGDASACLKLLQSMAEEEPGMFVRYLADEQGRLVHLFWADNCSQLDYEVFGDVLAFDATYRKNKYMCPLVVFSGVNHHNQTIFFASALVANETEETYRWLLEQFLEAMKGKAPGCVITDGHGAMKKAIEAVFPNAYHRLCAWHLIRNATSNLSNPTFNSGFKKCMLSDLEISEFEERWERLISELGLEENEWVGDLYSRRKMWATAHIRGHFFGGFRTTSRCEGLHSMLGKFVHSRHNLKDFVEQFFRCISQMRSREAQSDLNSVVGNMVLQSPFHSLERSAADRLTREIFLLFRPMLLRACTLKVCTCTYTPMCEIFTIVRSGNSSQEWRVSHYPEGSFFKCSCMRMESLGIPCDHIIAVLVYLEITEMPDCLIMDRWSKNARARVREFMEKGPFCWDSMVTCRNWMLNDLCREMCALASTGSDEFGKVAEKIRNEIKLLKGVVTQDICTGGVLSTLEGCLRNPQMARHTKRRRKGGVNHPSMRSVKRCGICREVGHNRLSCNRRDQSRLAGDAELGLVGDSRNDGMESGYTYDEYPTTQSTIYRGGENDDVEIAEEDNYHVDVSLGDP